MGSVLTAYLVDLQVLRGIYGSRDVELARTVARQFADECRSFDQWHAREIAAGSLTLEQGLEAIAEGRTADVTQAAAYVQALALFCEYFGTPMRHELYEDFHGDWLDVVGVAKRLLEGGPPIPVPTRKDELEVGHLTAAQVIEELGRLGTMDFSSPDPDVHEARLTYVDWLERARDEKNDMLAFSFG